VPQPWNDDPAGSEPRILRNIADLLAEIAREADAREQPTVAMAQEWHRRIYDGVALPVAYYAGEIRDSDPAYPELDGYEVAVGPFPGAPSTAVPAALAAFERSAQSAVRGLDAAIGVGDAPQDNAELHGVIRLCALLHGEWVRIHPFANGNGRTGRLWANWAALRYGLPPFVTLKPRPGHPYGTAAMASMQGNHQPAIAAFTTMLRRHLSGSP
jgi:Fic family protein